MTPRGSALKAWEAVDAVGPQQGLRHGVTCVSNTSRPSVHTDTGRQTEREREREIDKQRERERRERETKDEPEREQQEET